MKKKLIKSIKIIMISLVFIGSTTVMSQNVVEARAEAPLGTCTGPLPWHRCHDHVYRIGGVLVKYTYCHR